MVIAATRSIGHRHAEQLISTPIHNLSLVRIVNNIPSRPLEWAERDKGIEQVIEKHVRVFQPDIVHIQHLQFLSSAVRFKCPTVITLHDSWFWCAAGGKELRQDLEQPTPCEGPQPARCESCVPHWNPQPSFSAAMLMRTAGWISRWVEPPVLHQLWQQVPSFLRAPISRPVTHSTAMSGAAQRNAAFEKLARDSTLVAPSRYLAERATKEKLPKPRVIRHGFDAPAAALQAKKGGFLFVGTLQSHKGPDLVAQAFSLAFPDSTDLRFIGAGDPALVRPFETLGPLPHNEVLQQIATAEFLVMGSVWPENSPMVISEARALGTPIIAPRIGGIPELIEEGVDGLLYPPGDVNAIARCMQHAVEQRFQFAPRKPPTAVDMLRQYDQLYRELVQ